MPESLSPTEAVRRYQVATQAVVDARVKRQRALNRDATELAAADHLLIRRQIRQAAALKRMRIVLSPRTAPVL